MKKLLTVLALATLSTPIWAATQAVTLSVPGMTCAACPITVRTALKRVNGVKSIDAVGETDLRVSYDDTRTSIAAIIDATKNAGYPSTVKK